MNRQEIEQNLRQISFGDRPGSNEHEKRLRAVLVQYGLKNKPSVFSWWKEKFKSMQMNFKASSFVAGTLVGLLVFGGVQAANNSVTLAKYNPFATNKAQAQAAVKDIMFKARALTPEERANIDKRMKADMEASLKEAYQAPDLTVVEGDEAKNFGFMTAPLEEGFGGAVASGTPKTMGFRVEKNVKVGGAGTAMFAAAADEGEKIVKQLKYTDPEGRKVTLGVGEDGLPHFKFMTLSEKEMINIKEQMQNGGAVEFSPAATWTPGVPLQEDQTFHINIDNGQPVE